jgi:hypothetical protein
VVLKAMDGDGQIMSSLLEKLRQKDNEFEDSLGCIVSPGLKKKKKKP